MRIFMELLSISLINWMDDSFQGMNDRGRAIANVCTKVITLKEVIHYVAFPGQENEKILIYQQTQQYAYLKAIAIL